MPENLYRLIDRASALPEHLRKKAMDNVEDARRDLGLWPDWRIMILNDLERAIKYHEEEAMESSA